jgi:hypothetical protein
MTTEMVEQFFQITGPARLQVGNVCGSVIVQPGEAGVIRVTAAKHTHTGDAARTQVEISQAADGSVSANTRYAGDGALGWLFGSHPCEVDYVVKVPAECAVKVSSVSGGTSITDIQGECDVRSVSGEVTLLGVKGPMRLDTVSGSVAGQNLSGVLRAKTVSGALNLRTSDFPQAEINTVSGDVLLETSLHEGPYGIHSVSGSARLIVPPTAGCVVDLHSLSGQFGSDLPVNMVDRRPGNTHADVQGGGPQVHMKSVSGCLWLETTDKSAIPVPPAPPSRHELLDRLERGEISVDETLTALRG